MARLKLSRALSDPPITAKNLLLRISREVVPTLRELLRAWNDWVDDGNPGAITVRDAGTDIGQREAVNLHAGAGISLTIADDSTDEEVDITITSTISAYTDEQAQDAVGAMIDTTLNYVDATPLLQRAAITGAVKIAAGSNASTFGDLAGLSVLGVTGSVTATPAAITAGTDAYVLRRSGTALSFGQVATGGITDNAVTNAKLATMAQGTIKGRASGAGTGTATDLTDAQVRTIVSPIVSLTSGSTITFDTSTGWEGLCSALADDGATINFTNLASGMHGTLTLLNSGTRTAPGSWQQGGASTNVVRINVGSFDGTDAYFNYYIWSYTGSNLIVAWIGAAPVTGA